MPNPTVRLKRHRPRGPELRWTLWVDEDHSAAPYATALIVALARGEPVAVELLDCDASCAAALEALGAKPEACPGYPTPCLPALHEEHVAPVIAQLESHAFTVWTGVRLDQLPADARTGTNRRRAESLPSGAAYLVCSLYDSNLELHAPAPNAPAIEASVRAAARATNHHLVA